jgi:hypothetical protein
MRKENLPSTIMDNVVVSVVDRLSYYFHPITGQLYMLIDLTECYYDKGKKRKYQINIFVICVLLQVIRQ